MVITVSYEIPLVFDKLALLFEWAYTRIFPVGAVIAALEGFRVGMSGEHYSRAGSVDSPDLRPSRPPPLVANQVSVETEGGEGGGDDDEEVFSIGMRLSLPPSSESGGLFVGSDDEDGLAVGVSERGGGRSEHKEEGFDDDI
jgi:hypothetical protein